MLTLDWLNHALQNKPWAGILKVLECLVATEDAYPLRFLVL